VSPAAPSPIKQAQGRGYAVGSYAYVPLFAEGQEVFHKDTDEVVESLAAQKVGPS